MTTKYLGYIEVFYLLYESDIFNNLCFNFQAVTFKDALLPLFFELTIYG